VALGCENEQEENNCDPEIAVFFRILLFETEHGLRQSPERQSGMQNTKPSEKNYSKSKEGVPDVPYHGGGEGIPPAKRRSGYSTARSK